MTTAYELPGFSFSLPADTDWSSGNGQFRFVTVNSTGEAIAPNAGGRAIGVRQNMPKAGEATTIVNGGIVFVEASEAITTGNEVSTTVNGRAQVVAGGEAVLGVALNTVSGAGELVSVLLTLDGSGTGYTTAYSVIALPVTLAGATTGDLLTGYVPGFAGTILAVSLLVTTATTDVDADATINLEIGTTNLTGGVITIADTAAGATALTPAGKVLAGTAVTGNNTFTDSDAISIETVVTNGFTDGAGLVLISIAA